MKEIELVEVEQLPKELEPDKIYLAAEIETTGHVCPCGCGAQIIIPIGGGAGWDMSPGPTLSPSLRNRKCKAHYFIRDGRFEMCSDSGR